VYQSDGLKSHFHVEMNIKEFKYSGKNAV